MKVIITVLIITICYLFLMTKLEYYRESNLISLTSPSQIENSSSSSSLKESSSIDERIEVEISGQVNKPGKYKVHIGDDLFSLVEKAGGLTEFADQESVDLYYGLTELDLKIYIPKDNGGNKISINTADLETLQILPGIGESTALKIIDYRNTNGDFILIDHIKRVNGIGDSVFNKIKDFITVWKS